MRFWALLALLLGLVSCGNEGKDSSTEASGSEGGPLKIAVIPKGTTHEFWKSVHAGAEKAAAEMKVEIVWKGPLKEDDLKQQVDLVESFTAQGVSGIVLAPLNDKALVKVVKDAKRAGIPTVVIDSALQGEHHTSFVATDNRAAGTLAGEHLAKLLGGKGKVVVLRYQEGSASTAKRETGFIEAAKASGLTVVSDNQYAGATTESAFSASESLLQAKKASEDGVDGIFTPNESTTFGMLRALRTAGLAGKVKLVGFDASDKLLEGLKAGDISGLVVQNPHQMGYLGVKTMVAHLRGEKVEASIDTGSVMVDAENLGTPEVQRLVAPQP